MRDESEWISRERTGMTFLQTINWRGGTEGSYGNGNRVEHGINEALNGHVVGERVECTDDAVAQDAVAHFLDVVGHDVVASRHEGQGLGDLHERDAATRGGTHAHVLLPAGQRVGAGSSGGVDDVDDVGLEGLVDEDAAARVLEDTNVVEADRVDIGDGCHLAGVDAGENLELFDGRRVGDDLLEEDRSICASGST